MARLLPSTTSSASPQQAEPYSDVDRFVAKRALDWKRLDALLSRVEAHGLKGLGLSEVRALGRLYRSACGDLLVARGELMDATLTDFLDGLVARAYALVYARRFAGFSLVRDFLWREFPLLVRRELRLIGLSGAFLALGAILGALVLCTDSSALAVVVPDMHLDHTPTERIQGEALGKQDAGDSAIFSSFLFTHNIQVTFLVFALGLTFGLGTAVLLFWNGIPLGALAAQYHLSGQGLFFWAWILPHGVVELSVVVIAGASGFVLARGLWFPGARTRSRALAMEARTAVRLVLGGMPWLVLAGIVEGTISQMHAPLVPYTVKLVFALALFLTMLAYLWRPRKPAALPGSAVE